MAMRFVAIAIAWHNDQRCHRHRDRMRRSTGAGRSIKGWRVTRQSPLDHARRLIANKPWPPTTHVGAAPAIALADSAATALIARASCNAPTPKSLVCVCRAPRRLSATSAPKWRRVRYRWAISSSLIPMRKTAMWGFTLATVGSSTLRCDAA